MKAIEVVTAATEKKGTHTCCEVAGGPYFKASFFNIVISAQKVISLFSGNTTTGMARKRDQDLRRGMRGNDFSRTGKMGLVPSRKQEKELCVLSSFSFFHSSAKCLRQVTTERRRRRWQTHDGTIFLHHIKSGRVKFPLGVYSPVKRNPSFWLLWHANAICLRERESLLSLPHFAKKKKVSGRKGWG